MALPSTERSILLAIDGSRNADYAFEFYCKFIALPKDKLVLFHFMDPVSISKDLQESLHELYNIRGKCPYLHCFLPMHDAYKTPNVFLTNFSKDQFYTKQAKNGPSWRSAQSSKRAKCFLKKLLKLFDYHARPKTPEAVPLRLKNRFLTRNIKKTIFVGKCLVSYS